MKSFTGLIVDDSFIMVKKISKIVKELGWEVVGTAKNGNQAILEYRTKKPDFVTMDITMPDMDGIEATKKILEIDPDAVIIMITSHGQQMLVLEAIQAGAKGYILKPIEELKTKSTLISALLQYRAKPVENILDTL